MRSDPRFYHDDGRLKSSNEMQAYRDAKAHAKQEAKFAAEDARREAAEPQSPFASRLKILKSSLESAMTHRERAPIKRRLAIVKEAEAKWQADQANTKWKSEFDKSPLAQQALTSLEAMRRSGKDIYPSITDDQLNGLLSTYEVRHEFLTADAFGRHYFALLAEVEDQEADRAQKAATDARIESERLQAEQAKEQTKAIQAQQRRAQLPEVA